MLNLFKNKHSVPTASGPVQYIIAGLGNPGQKYEGTRHNIGFITIDMLAQELNIKVDRLKFKSLCCDTSVNGIRSLIMKPQTFMNNSGEAIRDAMQFYKIPPQRVIIIYDDISLSPGSLRIRSKGTDGGHNGIKSIIYLTGSDQFPRIKIGVGAKPHPDYDLAAWVLSGFKPDDIPLVKQAAQNAIQALKIMVTGDIQQAMNKYNRTC